MSVEAIESVGEIKLLLLLLLLLLFFFLWFIILLLPCSIVNKDYHFRNTCTIYLLAFSNVNG